MEQATRNFIWSVNINTRKFVTVAWKKVCLPKVHGGLGIRSIIVINNASNLKLGWDIIASDEYRASLVRARVLMKHGTINRHIPSTMRSTIKHEFQFMQDNSTWL